MASRQTHHLFTLHILAAVAEHERLMIAARTKAALAASKARGVKLGGWRGGPKVDVELGRKARSATSQSFAQELASVFTDMRSRGLPLRSMAVELNTKGILSARGGQWSAVTVRDVLSRIA